jgi:hypothetical protein
MPPFDEFIAGNHVHSGKLTRRGDRDPCGTSLAASLAGKSGITILFQKTFNDAMVRATLVG